MAIEKRIELEEDAISADIPTSDEITAMEDGGAEVTLTNQTEIDEADAMGLLQDDPMMDTEHDANLADVMEESDIQAVSQELLEGFDRDKQSREEYDEIAEDGINLLGLQYDDSAGSFPGSSGVTHPVLAQAVVKFQAKAYKELFPTEGPVRTRIMGTQTQEKLDQANRVRQFLNWQTQTQMPEYGPELDKMLFHVALYGTSFKKTYFNPALQRPITEFIKAQDFYVDYYASDLETAERYTHKYLISKNEIKKMQLAGVFRDMDVDVDYTIEQTSADELSDETVGSSKPGENDDYANILEMHVNIDLPGFEDPDGIKLPYIVHMTEDGDVLAIRRNYDEEDMMRKKKMYFTHYTMIPGLGFYGYGYIHLIGGLTKTATSSMRQLIDAGTFANLPGGFKAHGLRVLAPDEPIAPGEFREVNAPAGDLGKSLQILPFKEPSSTLFNLMDYASKLASQFADSTDNVVENATNYGPVGTTMALLEQSSKLFSAVHKRLHAAQTKDLRILTRLDYEYLPDLYPYEVAGGAQQVFKKDFNLKSIDVIPVSDPNMPTEAHRIAKINAIMSIAQQNPAAYNMEQIGMELFSAMGVDEPQRYLKQQQQPISADPISENMAALKGAPLQAKPEQNHDAHIIAHGTFMQNPSYESPAVQQLLISHMQDHLAMKYQQQMAQMVQDPRAQQMIMSGQQLPPEMENQIALMAADASDKVLKLDEEKTKIMNGEKKDSSQEQLEIQKQDLALRAKKLMDDMKMHQDKMDLQESKIMIDDENKDEDRKLKEAQMAMDSAEKLTSNVDSIISTTIGRQ
jgi:chaperonin GroES